jgi:hypothetical protein
LQAFIDGPIHVGENGVNLIGRGFRHMFSSRL